MGGKAALLLVLGFSLILMVFGYNFNNLGITSVDNIDNYYVDTKAYNIAVAGANLAANTIFMDKNWDEGFSDIEFDDGILNVYVSNNLDMSGKTIICHIPAGNPNARHTISVNTASVAAHLSHGDYIGPCSGDTIDSEMATIISEGTYHGVTKVVIVELRPSYFSKYGNFYTSISAMPATGDTFNGPFHTNGKLYTYGQPVFWGKTTSRTGLKKYGSPADPKFYGGFEDGIDIPLEFDTSGFHSAATSGGKVFYDTTHTGQKVEVELDFLSSGNITYKQKIGTGSWSTSKTIAGSSLAPNGVIYIERGNVYVKGTINGKYTIAATKKSTSGCGNVYQTDNIQYQTDPISNTNSDDILGLVAEENIRIQNNANTIGDDVITHASMFALNGNIGPDDGLVHQPTLHSWRIVGGLIAKTTRVTADYSGSTPTNGLRFYHTYDTRFMRLVPPKFPHTDNYEIVSWYE